MEDKRSRLESLLFKHLDGTLPDKLKKKLSSSDCQTIVTSLVNFIHQSKSNVLLDPTTQGTATRGKSIFDTIEEPDFMSDLAEL